MTKTIQTTCRAALSMLAVLTMLFLLSAPVLAAAAEDTVEIGEDGTVTLVSDRLAGEKVSSVQVRISVSAAEGQSVSFQFDRGLDGLVTKTSSYRDGVLNIYIAGAAPLMTAGQVRLILGAVSGADMQSVELPEDALQYVYGKRVIAQSAEVRLAAAEPTATPTATPEAESAPVASPSSGAREDLQKVLESAKDFDAAGYTKTSFDVLLAAIQSAEEVLAKAEASDEELTAAAVALQKAIDQLVPVAAADGSGPVIGDGADDGTGAGAPEPTATPVGDTTPSISPEFTGSTEPTPTAAASPTAGPTASPAASGQAGAPNTGDDTPTLLWAMILLLSGGTLAAVMRRGKCRR